MSQASFLISKLLVAEVMRFDNDVDNWNGIIDIYVVDLLKTRRMELLSIQTRLAIATSIVGSQRLELYTTAFRLLCDWEHTGGPFWLVQEEILRFAAVHIFQCEIYGKNLDKSVTTRNIRNQLPDVLPNDLPAYITHKIVKARIHILRTEFEWLLDDLRRCPIEKTESVLLAYTDQYPLSHFVAWFLEWAQNLLLKFEELVLCHMSCSRSSIESACRINMLGSPQVEKNMITLSNSRAPHLHCRPLSEHNIDVRKSLTAMTKGSLKGADPLLLTMNVPKGNSLTASPTSHESDTENQYDLSDTDVEEEVLTADCSKSMDETPAIPIDNPRKRKNCAESNTTPDDSRSIKLKISTPHINLSDKAEIFITTRKNINVKPIVVTEEKGDHLKDDDHLLSTVLPLRGKVPLGSKKDDKRIPVNEDIRATSMYDDADADDNVEASVSGGNADCVDDDKDVGGAAEHDIHHEKHVNPKRAGLTKTPRTTPTVHIDGEEKEIKGEGIQRNLSPLTPTSGSGSSPESVVSHAIPLQDEPTSTPSIVASTITTNSDEYYESASEDNYVGGEGIFETFKKSVWGVFSPHVQ